MNCRITEGVTIVPTCDRAALRRRWRARVSVSFILLIGTCPGCDERLAGSPPPARDAAAQTSSAVAARPALRIIDGDTLELNGERHRLFGIDAPEAGATCIDTQARFWPCGEHATQRLRELTQHRAVRCEAVPGERDGYGRRISRCRADGIDVADRLVRDGLAWAYVKYSREHSEAQAQARQARRGVWQARNEPPWRMRARRRAERDALAEAREPTADAACRIKGNVSASGRIYHLPGSRDYAATRISTRRGERWFCSEADALAAGWRARR